MVNVQATKIIQVDVVASGADAVVKVNGVEVAKITEDSAAPGKVKLQRLGLSLDNPDVSISAGDDKIKVNP